jgi:hypothetical protein
LISTPDTLSTGHAAPAPSASLPGQRAYCQTAREPPFFRTLIHAAAIPSVRRCPGAADHLDPVTTSHLPRSNPGSADRMAKPTGTAWEAFARRLSFASADPARTLSLAGAIAAAERQVGGSPGRLFHLATLRRPSCRRWPCSAAQAWPAGPASSSRSRAALGRGNHADHRDPVTTSHLPGGDSRRRRWRHG